MKKLFTAVILGIALAGVALAQKGGERQSGKSAEVKVAVVEFSLESNVSGVTAEAKRQLQSRLKLCVLDFA